MKKTGKRRANSPFRQFYLAGIHVNTDKLRQLDCWLALAPDIASKSDATNSWSHAADHAHFEHPRNRITDVSVNTVYLLGRTGVLKDFDQLAPTGRILLFSGTRGHRSAKSIRWGRVKQRGRLGSPARKSNKNLVPSLSFPHRPSCPSPFLSKKKSSHGLQNRWYALSFVLDDLLSLITVPRLQMSPLLPLGARKSKSPNMRCQVSCT